MTNDLLFWYIHIWDVVDGTCFGDIICSLREGEGRGGADSSGCTQGGPLQDPPTGASVYACTQHG